MTIRFMKIWAQLKTLKLLSVSDSKKMCFITLTFQIFEANTIDMNDIYFLYCQLKIQNAP